jgi:hypothetical protein
VDDDDFESREQELADPNPRPWDPETVGSIVANVGPLSPVAVPIVLVAKAIRGQRCPHCKGRLGKGATVCKHCGRDVP